MNRHFKKAMETWAQNEASKFTRIVEEVTAIRIEGYDYADVKIIQLDDDCSLIAVEMFHDVILVRLMNSDDQELVKHTLEDMTEHVKELQARGIFDRIDNITCLNIMEEKSISECKRVIDMTINQSVFNQGSYNVLMVLLEIDEIIKKIEDEDGYVGDLYRLLKILKSNDQIKDGPLAKDEKYKKLHQYYYNF